jgi:hypothetical protein
VLVQVDQARNILTQQTRLRAKDYLARYVGLAAATQASDGSWTVNWHDSRPTLASDIPFSKLLTTGHQLEWCALVPVESGKPSPNVDAAATWICENTPKVVGPSEVRLVCPWTHCVRAIKHRIQGASVPMTAASGEGSR